MIWIIWFEHSLTLRVWALQLPTQRRRNWRTGDVSPSLERRRESPSPLKPECLLTSIWKSSRAVQTSFLPPLREVLSNGLVEKSVHDLKRAVGAVSAFRYQLEGVKDDTFLAAYLLDPNRSKYELNDLAREALESGRRSQPNRRTGLRTLHGKPPPPLI